MAYKDFNSSGELSALSTATSGTAVAVPAAGSANAKGLYIANESDSAADITLDGVITRNLTSADVSTLHFENPARLTLTTQGATNFLGQLKVGDTITFSNTTTPAGIRDAQTITAISGSDIIFGGTDGSGFTGTFTLVGNNPASSTVGSSFKVGRGRRFNSHKPSTATTRAPLPGIAEYTFTTPTGWTNPGNIRITGATAHGTAANNGERVWLLEVS